MSTLTIQLHQINEEAAPESLELWAESLVRAAGGATLDAALSIAERCRQETLPTTIRNQALRREADTLRQRLSTIEESLKPAA